MPLLTCLTRSLPPSAWAFGFCLASWRPGVFALALLGMRRLRLPRLVPDRLGLDPALARDLPHGHEPAQPVHRGAHRVVRVVAPQALGQDVVDAGALEHRAHRTAGDDPRPGPGRLDEPPGGPLPAPPFL